MAIDVWICNLNTYGSTLPYENLYTRNASISTANRTCTYIAGGTATTSSSPNVSLDPNSNLILTGSQIAATLYENGIFCDITNNNDTPKTACDWLLSNYGYNGLPTSVLSDHAIHTTAGNLNGCIVEKKPLHYWLNRIAFEFRSRFKYFADGTAKMIYRPDTLTSAGTVTTAQTRNFQRRKTDYDDIINKVDLRYTRDWSNSATEPYTDVTSVSDSASQTKFGTREKSDLFMFDFITTRNSVAAGIVAYYLSYYKQRRWRYELEVFLDNLQWEYADPVTMSVASKTGVITETRLTPGSATEPDTITMIIEG